MLHFAQCPFGIHKACKEFRINPNESSLKLSDVPVKCISFEHHDSKTDATHLWPVEELVEEDALSFAWLSLADGVIS